MEQSVTAIRQNKVENKKKVVTAVKRNYDILSAKKPKVITGNSMTSNGMGILVTRRKYTVDSASRK